MEEAKTLKTPLYFPINKCGTTSLKRVFANTSIIVPNLNTIDNALNLHRLKPRFPEFFKFCVVRHPLDRFLSTVNMLLRQGKFQSPTIAVATTLEIMAHHQGYALNGNLRDYIKRHTLPCCHPLYCVVDHGQIVVDQVFKMEEWNWKKWGPILGLPSDITIPRLNANRDPLITRHHLSSEQLNFLKEYYA